jgi:hypothetical protein
MCGHQSSGNYKVNIILNINIHSSHSIGVVQGLLYLHTHIQRNLTPLSSSSKIPLRKKKGPSIVVPFFRFGTNYIIFTLNFSEKTILNVENPIKVARIKPTTSLTK